MVTTRSKTVQSRADDGTKTITTVSKKQPAGATKRSPYKANTSKKRKSVVSSEPAEEAPAAKRAKTAKTSHSANLNDDQDPGNIIIINRAPVLQLWSACVTHFVYPQLDWETCLSAGSAISSICAVAKGRSIGAIPEKDESEAEQRKRNEGKKKMEDLDVIDVMHFKLHLKNGRALVGSVDAKGKPGSEDLLRKKFGKEEYERVQEAFDEALQSWEGEEEELSEQAFGFYEQFRPDTKGGQKGWGRKSELNLERVKSIVER